MELIHNSNVSNPSQLIFTSENCLRDGLICIFSFISSPIPINILFYMVNFEYILIFLLNKHQILKMLTMI